MRKKGSLNLSMNAIVILILAITLLGLGLSFMRGLFKQMEGKVNEAVSAQELSNPPTMDNVLTTAPGDITLRKSEVGEIIIAYMSTYAGEDSCSLDIDNTGGAVVADLKWSSSSTNMQQDQINKWTVGVDNVDGATTGTELQTATMTCTVSSTSYTKDIIITFTD